MKRSGDTEYQNHNDILKTVQAEKFVPKPGAKRWMGRKMQDREAIARLLAAKVGGFAALYYSVAKSFIFAKKKRRPTLTFPEDVKKIRPW